MPRKDGTGPNGFRSMTGRGFGSCSGTSENICGTGRGLACRRGFGKGFGRGFRRAFAENQPLPKMQKEVLQQQKDVLQSRLDAIEKQLQEA